MIIKNFGDVKSRLGLDNDDILDEVNFFYSWIPKLVNFLELTFFIQISNHNAIVIIQTDKSIVIGGYL